MAQSPLNLYEHLPAVAAFTVVSTDLLDGGELPTAHVHSGYGHGGKNLSPHLSWTGAPKRTRSYTVTCVDPDAPSGPWWHWALVDLPPDVSELPTGAGSLDMIGLPDGAYHLANDFHTRNYGGAAPPSGPPHQYVFAVHALDVDELDVHPDETAVHASPVLYASTIARAVLVATYGV